MTAPSHTLPAFCLSRRHLLASALAASGCAKLPSQSQSTQLNTDADWQQASQIVANIKVPSFAQRDFAITHFGAQPESDASFAIKEAIAACHQAGGGRVVIPAGHFHTGPIHLKSHVNLHLEQGAKLTFSTDPARYLPEVLTRWEGMELMGFSPLIYAYQQTNIAITGEGVLDGGASMANWWPWKANDEWHAPGFPSQAPVRQRLMSDVEAGKPVRERRYGKDNYLRPPFIQLYQCQTILIENVTLLRSPFWLINPVLCNDVTIRGVHLESLGPNSDGCNPESCKNVLIERCFFDTGDDCIAIKSGRNADGRRLATPSEDIVIRDCQMRAGHGGVVLGSEISGGARNIFVENCHMSSPDLDRGLRIKTNSIRGGTIEHLRFRNITIGQVRDALVINFYYEEGDAGKFDPTVRDIVIENLICEQAERAFQVRGFARKPIEQLHLQNVHFLKANQQGSLENIQNLTIDKVTLNGELITGY